MTDREPVDLEEVRRRITLCLDLDPEASTIQVVLDAIRLADEVERLSQLIDCAGKHWLSLEPGIAWEGAIDSAMEAAVAEIRRLRRWATDTFQDDCENAYVGATLHDTFRQALHEVAPDHPVFSEPCPSYGVWESQRKEIERLREALDKLARLGAEPEFGNSIGNDIARAALEEKQ